MLKRLFAGLPTKPIFFLAVAILALGLTYHLSVTYERCSTNAGLREALRSAIQASADGRVPLVLATITDFTWDRADIYVNYKPGGSPAECPFRWDWSQKTREALIDNDLLTVVVFIEGGEIVNYIEYRRDWAEFVGIENPYTPQTAVFTVEQSSSQRHQFVLSPAKGGEAR